MATYILTAAQLNSRILNSFSIPSSGGPVIIVDADAQAFITAAAITDTTQQAAIDNLVIGLKADSLWVNMYAIYPLVGGTASQHKYNLKDPRDLNAAYRLQFNGGMTHSSNGILFNGTNGWADTSAITTIATFGAYTKNATASGVDYMGTQDAFYYDDGENQYWQPISGYQLAQGLFIISNGYNPQLTSNPSPIGLSVVTNDGSQKSYKNGILRNTGPSSGLSSPGYTMAIGALNPNSNTQGGIIGIEGYSDQQIAFAFMANVSFNATQNTNLYNRIQTFQTSLGRQV
jgi:hypothetical protein